MPSARLQSPERPERRPMLGAEFRGIRRALRTDAGRPITQSQLADVMGYASQSAISFIETSSSDVPGQAQRLIESYQVGYRPPDWP